MVHQDCADAEQSRGILLASKLPLHLQSRDDFLYVVLNKRLTDFFVQRGLQESIISQEEVGQHGIEIMKSLATNVLFIFQLECVRENLAMWL